MSNRERCECHGYLGCHTRLLGDRKLLYNAINVLPNPHNRHRCNDPRGRSRGWDTVYLKKYAHGFVVLCFVVLMRSFIMDLHEVFIHIHQGCFAGTGAIIRLPQCQWSKPDGYWKISVSPQQSTAKQKPCARFLGYTDAVHALRNIMLHCTAFSNGFYICCCCL